MVTDFEITGTAATTKRITTENDEASKTTLVNSNPSLSRIKKRKGSEQQQNEQQAITNTVENKDKDVPSNTNTNTDNGGSGTSSLSSSKLPKKKKRRKISNTSSWECPRHQIDEIRNLWFIVSFLQKKSVISFNWWLRRDVVGEVLQSLHCTLITKMNHSKIEQKNEIFHK